MASQGSDQRQSADAGTHILRSPHSDRDEAFECAVCRREISLRWNRRGQDEIIPPICRSCEQEYARGIGPPRHGAFRDRREVMRGFALAEALRCEAAWMQWPPEWRGSHV